MEDLIIFECKLFFKILNKLIQDLFLHKNSVCIFKSPGERTIEGKVYKEGKHHIYFFLVFPGASF